MNATIRQICIVVLTCIAVGITIFGLWFNSFLMLLIGITIGMLTYLVYDAIKTWTEDTDRLYELYMEERDKKIVTTDTDNEIKRLDALTKELRVELSTLKMRVDNIAPTLNVPYVHTPDTVPYNPNQWQVYCKETKPNVENGKWTVSVPDTQTAEIKTSDIGEIMPTMGVEQTYYDTTTGKLNVGSGEITVSTPLQYKEEEIPTTDLK